MKQTFILFLIAILCLPVISLAQNVPTGQMIMHKVKKERNGIATPQEILVPVPNSPQACSPPNPTSLACNGSSTFNINSGYVGGDPTLAGGCGQCCYTGSDLDCDGEEEVSFSVENSEWYKYCNSTSSTVNITFVVDEPGSGSSCNIQGAIWVGTSLNSTTLSCNNPTHQEYGSNPGGNADGFTFTATVPPGSCAYIMIDGYAGATCSGVTITATCAVLPIQLSSFDVIANGKAAKLSWTTASEMNNNFFVVERGTDGTNFSPIATVRSKGNSSNPQSYQIIDNTLTKGTFYYRLKQVDFDGNKNYSSTRSLKISEQSVFNVIFSEGTNYASVIFDAASNKATNIAMYDNNGRLISSKQVSYTSGYNNLKVDISNLPKGIYFISMDVDGTMQKGKLIKY
jgi:hypothetical protein